MFFSSKGSFILGVDDLAWEWITLPGNALVEVGLCPNLKVTYELPGLSICVDSKFS